MTHHKNEITMKLTVSVITAALSISSIFMACSDTASDTPTAVTISDANAGSSEKLTANKKLVTDFYQALIGDKDSTAIDKYVGDSIKQHNPLLHDGKEGLKADLRPYWGSANMEKTKIEIIHSAAEGDLVWLHVKDVAPNGKVFARVNIFRVADGKIVEAWKVAEAMPKEAANQNSPF